VALIGWIGLRRPLVCVNYRLAVFK